MDITLDITLNIPILVQVHHKFILHGWVKIKWVQNVLDTVAISH